MGMTAGELWASGLRLLKKSDADTKKDIKKVLNQKYFEAARWTNWASLRAKKELVFVGTETTGQFLPSDLVKVTGVVSEADSEERVYYPTEENKRYSLDGRSHWYHPQVNVAPQEEKKTGITVSEGAELCSGAPAADYTDSYVRFYDEPGLYLLTGQYTFSPTYWGPRVTNKGYVVRPRTTKKLQITDAAGDADSQTVQVFYWHLPTPLYQEWQEPVFGSGRALQLMMYIELIGPGEKRQREANEYRRELFGIPGGAAGVKEEEIGSNPQFVQPQMARDRQGQPIFFGRRTR